MSRRTVPKGEQLINEVRMKNNSEYMSVFGLERQKMSVQNLTAGSFAPMNTTKLLKDEELIENVRNMIKYDNISKNSTSRHLKSVSSKPIISKIPAKTFMINYPINDAQLLNVCETRVFVLKNYCNYLHDDEIQKAAIKIQERNTNFETQANMYKTELAYLSHEAYESKYPVDQKKIRKEEEILDPKHVLFGDRSQTFVPKQKDRMEMSRNRNANGNRNSNGWNNY